MHATLLLMFDSKGSASKQKMGVMQNAKANLVLSVK